MALRSLILALLILASASPVRAQSCDFGGADTVSIIDWVGRRPTRYVEDLAYIREPEAWAAAESWWNDTNDATRAASLEAFDSYPRLWQASFMRGRRWVGIIEVRGDATHTYALMQDIHGMERVGDDLHWHGCGTPDLDTDEAAAVNAWFERAYALGHERE